VYLVDEAQSYFLQFFQQLYMTHSYVQRFLFISSNIIINVDVGRFRLQVPGNTEKSHGNNDALFLRGTRAVFIISVSKSTR